MPEGGGTFHCYMYGYSCSNYGQSLKLDLVAIKKLLKISSEGEVRLVIWKWLLEALRLIFI